MHPLQAEPFESYEPTSGDRDTLPTPPPFEAAVFAEAEDTDEYPVVPVHEG